MSQNYLQNLKLSGHADSEMYASAVLQLYGTYKQFTTPVPLPDTTFHRHTDHVTLVF